MQFLMALLEHQVLLVILLMFFMGFVGMTYEFILRLFEKRSMKEWLPAPDCLSRWPDDLEDDPPPPPPEPAKVPKPPTGPKDTLVAESDIEGGEEVEDENGNTTFHYIYKSDELAPGYWFGLPEGKEDNKEKEREL